MLATMIHARALSHGCHKIFRESAITVEPSAGALDTPAARQEFEALGVVRALDDLQGPGPDLGERCLQLRAGVAAVGEDVTQPRVSRTDANTAGAPSRSWIPAEWTIAASSKPLVSLRRWRLRPLMHLPAS